jgi:hypothetical protein
MNKPTETIKNIAKCLLCGDIIESKHRHDYVTCKCGNLSVDGGQDYWKRSIVHGIDSYKELGISKTEEDKELNCCDSCDLNNPSCDKCLGS